MIEHSEHRRPTLARRMAVSLCPPLSDPRAGLSPGRVHRELERTQWFGGRASERLQESNLEGLLTYAREVVPFYREYPQCPGDGRGGVQECLASYVILSKDAIRANLAKMPRVDDLSRVCTRATGGTTGEAIEIGYGSRRGAMALAARRDVALVTPVMAKAGAKKGS